MAAFERCGRRPELLLAALRSLVLTPGASSAQQVDERLQQEVDRAVDVLRQAFEEELDQLPALQRALLARVAHPGGRFTAFAEATLAALRADLAGYGGDASVRVEVSSVQAALDALAAKGLI